MEKILRCPEPKWEERNGKKKPMHCIDCEFFSYKYNCWGDPLYDICAKCGLDFDTITMVVDRGKVFVHVKDKCPNCYKVERK